MASLSINTLRRMSICKSQAWKDTQRILKRSGLVYRGERSESFDPEKHFNRYTVRYWICPYISRHLLSLNPLLACCRRYSRGER